MFCTLILYVSGGTYSLKSTPNDWFFEKLFMAILFQHSEFLPEICWEEIAEENILFWCLAWGPKPGFTSTKPTHYLLDYGNFHEYPLHYEKVTTWCGFWAICSYFFENEVDQAITSNGRYYKSMITNFVWLK